MKWKIKHYDHKYKKWANNPLHTISPIPVVINKPLILRGHDVIIR